MSWRELVVKQVENMCFTILTLTIIIIIIYHMYIHVHVCVLSHFSNVWLCATIYIGMVYMCIHIYSYIYIYTIIYFESESCSVVFNSLQPHGLYSPWNSLGQNTGVSSCSLLQGIFPTQGSNPYITIIMALQKQFKIMRPQLSNLKNGEVEGLKVPVGFLQIL